MTYVPLNNCHPDPGVAPGPLPGLAPAAVLVEEPAGSDRRALPVLVRERNRLADAVEEALTAWARADLALVHDEVNDTRGRSRGLAWVR